MVWRGTGALVSAFILFAAGCGASVPEALETVESSSPTDAPVSEPTAVADSSPSPAPVASLSPTVGDLVDTSEAGVLITGSYRGPKIELSGCRLQQSMIAELAGDEPTRSVSLEVALGRYIERSDRLPATGWVIVDAEDNTSRVEVFLPSEDGLGAVAIVRLARRTSDDGSVVRHDVVASQECASEENVSGEIKARFVLEDRLAEDAALATAFAPAVASGFDAYAVPWFAPQTDATHVLESIVIPSVPLAPDSPLRAGCPNAPQTLTGIVVLVDEFSETIVAISPAWGERGAVSCLDDFRAFDLPTEPLADGVGFEAEVLSVGEVGERSMVLIDIAAANLVHEGQTEVWMEFGADVFRCLDDGVPADVTELRAGLSIWVLIQVTNADLTLDEAQVEADEVTMSCS